MANLNSAFLFFLFAVLATVAVNGQGTANLTTVTCGRNVYSRKQVDEATAEGCRLYQTRQTLGSNNYPHRFNNREALIFATSGPYQEFPILTSGNYTGRSPGPDRIVFTEGSNCRYAGAMTHTDAPTNNGFVLCVESKSTVTSSSTTQTTASPSSSPSRTAGFTGSTTSVPSSAGIVDASWRGMGWCLLLTCLMLV